MNNTTCWRILWSAALIPPQEMVPPDTLVRSCLTSTSRFDILGGTLLTELPLDGIDSNEAFLREHNIYEHQAGFNPLIEDWSTTQRAEEFVAFL